MLEKIVQFFNRPPSQKALNSIKKLEVELNGTTDLSKIFLSISEKEESIKEIRKAIYNGEISQSEVMDAVTAMLRKNVFNFAQKKYNQWINATSNVDPNCFLDKIVGKSYVSYALANGCFDFIEKTTIKVKEGKSWREYVRRNPYNDVLDMAKACTEFILNYEGKNSLKLD